jgi:hypothetical protein
LFFCHCGSTIEFIPDSDFRPETWDYRKKNHEEVEIFREKPKKAMRSYGIIYIRKFDGSSQIAEMETELKKKLFEWKMDGIWLHDSKIEEVAPTVIMSKNQAGMVVSYAESGKEMGKITGTPFRYKENGKRTKNF